MSFIERYIETAYSRRRIVAFTIEVSYVEYLRKYRRLMNYWFEVRLKP